MKKSNVQKVINVPLIKKSIDKIRATKATINNIQTPMYQIIDVARLTKINIFSSTIGFVIPVMCPQHLRS